ncbi:UvrABC system protein A [Moorella thermoacetica]|uniref:UvrABC system protein A n=1 Tax=Moorella thermoacetica (strain ATCC 39073 / JCM 9320) TaxID=264732 RepID=Q2RLU9_MOOTA|nr:excinuclease ABC subunit UvrA [Moorella thermoacetica]AKX95637.1 UvrABC system protein A [Moorella thermoacetica]OIQ11508.1 UvrABC system protein A [Moorella thermoacetica]OIQ53469.1 UvrABC system protein A [Moorella thermoacetica]QCZ99446.1 UvrABC system protein A [Moorella thermoacetica]TYL07688.1 UvrABC system protein A [Moorella thermoacetica]
MARDKIVIKGARAHNLKNIDVTIPRDQLVVITGLSGSGKSSLAFDTIYAEGQRRYVESLSSYARQFLGQMDKPDVDVIEGLSPAISIDQKTASHNPRSTVGTVTEIYDYLRLLFAHIGRAHCPRCGRPITPQTISQMVDRLLTYPEGTRLQVMAPIVRGRKGEYRNVLEEIRRQGYVRVRVDGEIRETSDNISLAKNKKHTIEVIVDRLQVRPGVASRLAESLETALKLADGVVLIDIVGQEELLLSEKFACVECGVSLPEVTPRLFSFNNPYGACPACTGLGVTMKVDPGLVIPDKSLTLREGAIAPWSRGNNGYQQMLECLADHYGFSLDVPVRELKPEHLQVILYGSGEERIKFRYTNRFGDRRAYEAPFEGVIPNLERRYQETQSEWSRAEIENYMSQQPCPACRGARLKPEALAVKVGGLNICELAALDVRAAAEFLRNLNLSEREKVISRQILKEILARLQFLLDVGLDYLTLDRTASTLSGGEAQRIRLATQIGSQLMGVLYILDEPSIGLHQRDNERLIATLKHLRDLGNTVIVVEHDEDTMRAADYIIDIGPGAGEQGGRVVAAGTVPEVMANPNSLTGQYLSGRRRIPVPAERRRPGDKWLTIKGAREHNLKGIDVSFPLGLFIGVTGVSGSGKSTLVNEILYRALAQRLNGARTNPGAFAGLTGTEYLDKVIEVDQSPIGRTPRSNPATYTGVFDDIRALFAATPEARARGYKPGRFSFNVKGGRCEACGGDGIIKIEMHFLPDVYVPCEVCQGKRYNRETLAVKYKGKSIADVLAMTVDEAAEFFAPIPRLHRRLTTLQDVGLGYITLGQPATTLSGGEAQRVKLATELARRSTGRTMYILDEPTTGLHMADIERLLNVLQRLVDAGNTVVVIEHNLDVIKSVDYIIDLGPEGGEGGGRVVATGTPEEVCRVAASYTGRFLAPVLERDRGLPALEPRTAGLPEEEPRGRRELPLVVGQE